MKRYWLTGAICLLIWGMMPCEGMGYVYAKGAEVYFGSGEYTWDVGEISHMGFYMESAEGENLEQVRMIVEYDPKVLELNSAADEGVTVVDEGKFMLNKTGDIGPVFKQIIYFKPLVSTDTAIEILSAEGSTPAGTISTDTEVHTAVNIPIEPGCRLIGISIDGTEIEEFDPDKMSYDLSVAGEKSNPVIVASAEEGTEVEISDQELVVGRNTVYITTTNRSGQKALYRLYVDREKPLSAQTAVQNDVDRDKSDDEGEEENNILSKEKDDAAEPIREDNFVKTMNERDLFSPESVQSLRKRQIGDLILKGMVIFICLLAGVEIVLLVVKKITEDGRKQKISSQERIKNRVKKRGTSGIPPIVIQAEHVCMDFDRAVNEYSSVKELVIQTIKGQRIKEKYRALDDVSFNIRKGKVVGVIGTNGAGKSTLLKIISGALRPSSGVMRVNRSKIQILTLGTGFDMELTGKENVYLNGAIIGYDKKFIDEHYEEIVEFAELQDFMNEKVKNYSSGMVSRLGFAIATVGQPPEILILDEVLSVGDQIFRKKSLKRIKELIHSGSTVIMVSHSTSTIRENCDKVIWLEKGHMIAMGNVKDVCDRYDRYDGDFEKLMMGRKNETDTLEWIV